MLENTFYLPFPPTINSYYSHTRNGVYISKKGRLFRESILDAVNQQKGDYFTTLSKPLQVDIILQMPDRRVRDLDNYMKALLDAVTKAEVWTDDSIIDKLTVTRGEIIKKGHVTMTITPFEQ